MCFIHVSHKFHTNALSSELLEDIIIQYKTVLIIRRVHSIVVKSQIKFGAFFCYNNTKVIYRQTQ